MISLRKINSILVLIIVLILLIHVLLAVLSMFGIISYTPNIKIMGRRLFYPLIAHIIISLYLYLSNKSLNIKVYSQLVSETTQQFVSGIFIVVFVTLHILAHMLLAYTNLILLVIDILLSVSISIHLKISIPRLLISFGFLKNKNSYNKSKRITTCIILIFLIVFIIADIYFFIGVIK